MNRFIVFLLTAAVTMTLSAAYACTEFNLSAKDGSKIIARTMEFAAPMHSELVSTPVGTKFTTSAPNGKPAMSWDTKYGYLFMNAFNQLFTVDGMNDQGLTFEYLYLPGITEYQAIPEGKESQALPYYNLGDWILGNFKNVDEVRAALSNIYVFEQTLPAIGKMVFPLHAAIHDASGKGIVVEFINGKMNIHDYVGVMTNSPSYDWHIANIKQYLNLSPINPEPIIVDGVSYASNGEGSGMLGLPGDISPPSRFVKMATLVKYSYQAEDALGAVNLAEHIINNVDIPLGVSRAKNNDAVSAELTQWSVFKDMTNKIIYYHTYGDLNLRSVDLKKINLSKGAPRLRMPLDEKPQIQDVSQQLNASKNN